MAAIGLVQMRRYPGLLERRKDIIARYEEGFADLPVETLKHDKGDCHSSRHLYLMRLTGKGVEERNRLIEQLAERGIASNVHYKPLPMHTLIESWDLILKIILTLITCMKMRSRCRYIPV